MRTKEELEAISVPTIRLFKVEMQSSDKPQDDCKGKWTLCDAANAKEFGANPYYFGRYLHQQLKVPVGLIHDCVSGTPGESWASPETIRRAGLPGHGGQLPQRPPRVARSEQAAAATEHRATQDPR